MIIHYLKIAIRNLLKYKTQMLISIIGLAAGFTCLALATLWIRYEMTYDSFHEGAERMYILYKKNAMRATGYDTNVSYKATELKKDFPEVEMACAISKWKNMDISVDGQPAITTRRLLADSSFLNMFQISVLSGSMDFMSSPDQIALTEETAMNLFGTTNILGKEVEIRNEKKTVCAIIKELKHSNLSFEYWEGTTERGMIIIRLREGANQKAFQKKLNDCLLMPLTQYYYSDVNEEKSIKFNYLILFSVVGALVILCSLLNYLSLFTTRIRMRSREMELRKTCGSSISNLFMLLITEYALMIVVSGILGMTIIELSLPVFRNISGIIGNIYIESFLYFLGILLLSILLLLPLVFKYSQKQRRGSRYLLCKISIFFQLSIGILFIFCTSVIIKQTYFLTHTDLGWDRKNIATCKLIVASSDMREKLDAIAENIQQLPHTREILKDHFGLLSQRLPMGLQIDNWDEKQADEEGFRILTLMEGEALVRFYNLQLLKGEMLKADDTNKIMINETAAKVFHMNEPIGKNIYPDDGRALTIIGVIKDFHTTPPTVPVQPTIFVGEQGLDNQIIMKGDILIKYHEGQWNELKTQVNNFLTRTYPDIKYQLLNTEDVYAGYLKSETTLLSLLCFVSLVCVLISTFGIFSLVTLSCEQRRKEIAIRKVNGATVKNILSMFMKEYLLLLVAASIVAFPIGYALMKRWLQSYIEQTAISTWIYFAIFGGIAITILISIIWRVWQAARQNPAEVIKSE